MSTRRWQAAVASGTVVVLGIAAGGCGSASQGATSSATDAAPPSHSAAPPSHSATPPSHSATPSTATGEVDLSKSEEQSARSGGRRACRGLTPLQAARRFRRDALKAGVTHRFAMLVAEPEPSVETSTGYPRLVASFYATTVAAPRRTAAAEGCAEELAASSPGR
jgi:hypothetical protein